MITKLLTYIDGKGHMEPTADVDVQVDAEKPQDGLTVKLSRPASKYGPDVYIERRAEGWYIGISPETDEVRSSVLIGDDGSMVVRNHQGDEVINEPPTPPEDAWKDELHQGDEVTLASPPVTVVIQSIVWTNDANGKPKYATIRDKSGETYQITRDEIK